MKTRVGIALSILVVAVAASTAYLSTRRHAGHSTVAAAKEESPIVPPMTGYSVSSEPRSATAVQESTKVVAYADSLKQSHNYLQFVRSTLGAAKSGDRDAQYFVGKALAFCDETYHMYFERKGQRLTLDEGLQWAAKLHRSNGFAQKIYDNCHELKDQDATELGNAADWMARAASAGQPAAQATMAIVTFSQEGFRNSSYHSGDAAPAVSNDPGADSRAQLRVAVESKDPETLWQIGVAQGFLNQSSADKVKNQLAWWLVSCQRGYDCSSGADWINLDCPDESYCTQGISGIDYIRKGSGLDWPDVQQRAQDINAKLDAGQWNDLGLNM